MSYSSDGRFLALSDWHEIQIRDAKNPLMIVTNLMRSDADLEMRVLGIAFSPRHLAAGYRDGKLVLWNRETWQQVATIRDQTSFLGALAFSPDGRMLAAGGSSHVINLWEVDALITNSARGLPLRPTAALRGHTQRITAVEFSHDGRTLVTASGDGTAKLWKLFSHVDSSVLKDTQRPIWFSGDGRQLIALIVMDPFISGTRDCDAILGRLVRQRRQPALLPRRFLFRQTAHYWLSG
jgi:WD40 repeat protein